jgi:AbiV family abortive infection protein
MRLEERIHENAVRLFEDACVLYGARSFPSAYSLGILSYEELGKLLLVDHIGFESQLGDKESRYNNLQRLFSTDHFYSHRNKQAWGAYKPMKGTKFARVEEHMYSGKLERNKQDGFYVGFQRKRIVLPTRFGPSYAYNHLKYTLGLFENIRDLPFVWIWERSNKRTQKRADATLNHLQMLFVGLEVPKSLRGPWGRMDLSPTE